jgi:hypothetical protein
MPACMRNVIVTNIPDVLDKMGMAVEDRLTLYVPSADRMFVFTEILRECILCFVVLDA